MSRINTNIQSVLAGRVLGLNNRSLSTSLERLSTGLRVNRGSDDPAGLIASENLRAERASLGAAVNNAERAERVVSIAEGGLQEISSLLTELQGLITSSANTAGLSEQERAANQLQIDSILESIDRLAESTSFQGAKLLNGNLGFQASSVSAAVADFRIHNAKLKPGEALGVDVAVTQSAQQGALFFFAVGVPFGTLNLSSESARFSIEITGTKGSREFSFVSGTTIASVADAINTFKEVTGVSATELFGAGFRVDSTALGSDEFVQVKIHEDGGQGGVLARFQEDNLNAADISSLLFFTSPDVRQGIRDYGQDVQATINGVVASSRGATASINTDFLSVEIDLTTAASRTLGAINAFTITGGGAEFQLAGRVDLIGKATIGLDGVQARNIGRVRTAANEFSLADLAGGKALDVVRGDTTNAAKVVEHAIRDVSNLRGRLGAFQKNTVGATIRSLGVALENTTAAESAIRDTDFAIETANLTRSQILVRSSINILALAGQQPQNVLALLG